MISISPFRIGFAKMAALKTVLGVLALTSRAFTSSVHHHATRANNDMTLSLEPSLTGGFLLNVIKGEDSTTIGHIGRTLVSNYIPEEFDTYISLQVGNAQLNITTMYDEDTKGHGVRIAWVTDSSMRLEDCIDFGTKQWYGGPMQVEQVYPIQNAKRTYSAYVVTEQDNGAIVERYWLNSAGEYYYVDPTTPLFVDYHNIMANHICFGAQIASPYSNRRSQTKLIYDIWFHSNAKVAHTHAVANYLGHPSDLVDFRMVQHPIWSTWAQFSSDIDENNTLEFAQEIHDRGFENSQLEIDDLWEQCYGSLTVDEKKFSNLSETVKQIKELGFRVTLWIHPFINNNCEPWYSEALNNSYLLLNEDGLPTANWWNGNGSVPGAIDFTNPEAAKWWSDRVKNLADTYGIDSFKFDAGETSFLPQVSAQSGDEEMHPHNYVEAYVRTCAQFGSMIEVRAGFRTQDLPIFVRMVDRDSIWGTDNGLPTIITTAIQMNLAGYTFVLPDMIGGNGFNLNHEQADLPTRELFIRWVQATTFLPVMQYSYVPWNFDDETVAIAKKYTDLHAKHAEDIYHAMKSSVENGSPVNAPLWWLDPEDTEAQLIADEFLLGEDILVAPVLKQGETSRHIYLPKGTWLAEGNPDDVHEGPTWLRNYPAPLDTLPYFVRQGVPDSAMSLSISVVLVVYGVLVHLV